jgi:hypothetical protein
MGSSAILWGLPHDLEETRGNTLGGGEESRGLDLSIPVQAGEHLLVGVQHCGLWPEAAVALAPELGLEEGQQIPVQAGAQGVRHGCENLGALHSWEAIIEDVDDKTLVNSDVGNGFHAVPLAQTTPRCDVRLRYGLRVARCAVCLVPTVTSVAHQSANQNVRYARPDVPLVGKT